MRGSSRDDDFVELAVTRRLAPRVPQFNLKSMRGGADRTETRLQELERAVGEFAIQDGVDLRGDAEAVDVPERTQMSDDAGSRVGFERAPNLAALASQRIEDGMPCASRGHRATDGVADIPDELSRRARGAGYEIAFGRERLRRVAARTQATTGNHHDGAAMALRFQRGDNIRRREARADDQDAIPLLHRGKRVARQAIGDKSRIAP